MDAIKKKMQAMKLEKDNAMDRADACEQQAKDANLRAERVRSQLAIPLVFFYFLFKTTLNRSSGFCCRPSACAFLYKSDRSFQFSCMRNLP